MSEQQLEAPAEVVPAAAAGVAPVDPPEDVAPDRTRRSRSGSRTRKAPAAKADKAPRARSGGSRPRSSSRKPALGPRIAGLYTMAGMSLAVVPAPWAAPTGLALVEHSAACGKAWEQVAKDNPRVREALERLLAVSSFSLLLTAHAPIVYAAMVAAGKIPEIPEGLGGFGALIGQGIDGAIGEADVAA